MHFKRIPQHTVFHCWSSAIRHGQPVQKDSQLQRSTNWGVDPRPSHRQPIRGLIMAKTVYDRGMGAASRIPTRQEYVFVRGPSPWLR
jgi:hypothetical protein